MIDTLKLRKSISIDEKLWIVNKASHHIINEEEDVIKFIRPKNTNVINLVISENKQ